MSKTKALVGFIILLCMLFAIFEFIGILWLCDISRGLIVLSITVLFFANYNPKICCFVIFLILFSLAELVSLLNLIPSLANSIPYSYFYYSCNGLYALAYYFLVCNIVKSLNIKVLVKNFFIHLLVLGFLNSYLLYVLFKIIEPHLVTLGQVFIELSYTISVLLVLSASLISFLYKDTQKSLFMFMGSLCVVFAEVIQIAYLYISTRTLLDVFYTTLLVLAFCFFYKQASLVEEESSVLSGNEIYK